MERVLTLTAPIRLPQADVLRLAVVCGCALALILAGQPLPLVWPLPLI